MELATTALSFAIFFRHPFEFPSWPLHHHAGHTAECTVTVSTQHWFDAFYSNAWTLTIPGDKAPGKEIQRTVESAWAKESEL